MNFYKTRLFLFIMLMIVFQYSLLSFQPSLLFQPDILLAILCCLSLTGGGRSALLYGVIAGAVEASVSPMSFFAYIVTYGFIGWFINRLSASIDREMWHTRFFLIFIALTVKWLHLCFFAVVLYKIDILSFLTAVKFKIPAQFFSTIIISVFVFFVFDNFLTAKKTYNSPRW